MLPIKDANRSKKFPIITIALIIINSAVWIYQYNLDEIAFQIFIQEFGITPARLLENPKSMITHMFLHGSWLHIISNMWTLWIFGDNVEALMGRIRFIFFYILSGIGAAIIQILVGMAFGGSKVSMVGASGAISGILAAYMLYFPQARILTLIPIFFFVTFSEIPAIVFIGFWFLSQIINGIITLPFSGLGGVAWWAHIGGFLTGYYIAKRINPKKRKIKMIYIRL